MLRRSFLAAASLAAWGADVPRKAEEFTIRMPGQGKDILLSSFKGKVIALEFLLTTCPHCQRCSQTLNRLHRELGPQGFQPVGVAVNDMANMMVEDYVRQFNLNYPVGYSLRDPVIAFLQHPVMLMMTFPTLVLIDRAGQIRLQLSGSDPFFENEEKNIRDAVVPLLRSAPAGPAGAAKKKG